MLRVLHVICPEETGSIGGADLHVLDLCVAQREERICEPRVLVIGGSDDFLVRVRRLDVDVVADFERLGGVRRRLATCFGRVEADLVHGHGYEADTVAALRSLTGRPRRPCVMTSHGLITTGLRFKLTTALDVRCMRAAGALIAVSEAGARVLRRAVPRAPVHVIPNGLLPPREVTPDEVAGVRAELGAGAGDTLVGYVGRLSPEKRPDLFLDAAGRLASRCPDVRFALIGGGPLRDRVEAIARRSGVADRVALPGLRHDMDAVYGALDVLVLPSDTEGTPRVVIEAQMRGVPVVATAVGDVPALVEHEVTGLVVPPGDAAGLAAMTERLVADPALAARYALAARRSAGPRTAHQMARRVGEVYQGVLGRPGPALVDLSAAAHGTAERHGSGRGHLRADRLGQDEPLDRSLPPPP